MSMFLHPTPIGVSYDFILGYHAGQRLTRTSLTLPLGTTRAIGWRRCVKINEEVKVGCNDFVDGFAQGYQDELQGVAHPLSAESEEE
jgi:hypothetical protein